MVSGGVQILGEGTMHTVQNIETVWRIARSHCFIEFVSSCGKNKLPRCLPVQKTTSRVSQPQKEPKPNPQILLHWTCSASCLQVTLICMYIYIHVYIMSVYTICICMFIHILYHILYKYIGHSIYTYILYATIHISMNYTYTMYKYIT